MYEPPREIFHSSIVFNGETSHAVRVLFTLLLMEMDYFSYSVLSTQESAGNMMSTMDQNQNEAVHK